MSKFCPSCGEELVDNAKFCKNCGANLETNEKTDTQETASTYEVQKVENDHKLAIIAGYIFAFCFGSDSFSDTEIPNANGKITFNKNLILVLGIVTFITGIFKLITPFHSKVPVFGDLIPAVAGIVSGFCLLLDYYNTVTTIPISLPKKLDAVLIKSRRYVGIIVMVSALLHFLLPAVPLI